MNRLPNDNLHNLAIQMAQYTGPVLLGAQAGTDRGMLTVLSTGCFELLGEIGQRLCALQRVGFFDIQRESLWLAGELTGAYMREADCLLEIETQKFLRAMILRSLRCMTVISNERYLQLKPVVEDWSESMHKIAAHFDPFGGRKHVTA